MKKVNILLLLLLFAGMQNLAAQDEGLTIKVTPSVKAEGHLNFEGEEQRKGNTVSTTGDAEGRVKVSVDYKSMVGAVVEMEGDLNSAKEDTGTIGFGDDAYAYVHPLQSFNLGIEKEVFDIYLKGGRFEAGFQNAKYAGDDDWLKDVDPLGRDNRINMQLDLKIMNMITLRYGQSFAAFDDKDYGNDLGLGLLFEKAFGAHKLIASLGYVVDATNNRDSYRGTGNTGNDVTATGTAPKDFDQLGFSLAYEGTFDQIVLMPFFNIRQAGVINKPERLAYESGETSWNAGLKFQLKDSEKKFDMVGLGLDFDGTLNRDNLNAYNENKVKGDGADNSNPNKGLTGVQFKVWSDGLRSVMGDNFLSVWAKLRLETWVPDKGLVGGALAAGKDIERESMLKKFAFGLKQYFVNQTNASVALYAEFTVENIAPFTYDVTGAGYYSDDYVLTTNGDVSVYLDFGLDASFTGVFQK